MRYSVKKTFAVRSSECNLSDRSNQMTSQKVTRKRLKSPYQ